MTDSTASAATITVATAEGSGGSANIIFFFFIACTVASPILGSFIDHAGLRIGMMAAVLIWSLASASPALRGHTPIFGIPLARTNRSSRGEWYVAAVNGG